jgi:hypothetical protein
MNIKTINTLINNSSWADPESRIVYNFSNGKDLSINGKDHLNYFIKAVNKKIEIQIGDEKRYIIEYVNDFSIKLHNEKETIRLRPD